MATSLFTCEYIGTINIISVCSKPVVVSVTKDDRTITLEKSLTNREINDNRQLLLILLQMSFYVIRDIPQ